MTQFYTGSISIAFKIQVHLAMTTQKKGKKSFVFRKYQVIGAADAVDDQKYLQETFVDNGELNILRDVSDHRSIIVGRTGSGKTALLVMLETICEKVIPIAPGDVAINHIANSTTLRFFSDAGVKLDLFYNLLWRHVIAVEIIREHYHINNEQARDSFIQRMKDRFTKNKKRQDAIKYLLDMGDSFWLESEHRIREVTQILEEKLENSLNTESKVKLGGFAELGANSKIASARNLTTQETADIVHHSQPVVDAVQMRQLGQIIELIEKEMLVDEQKRYYITIDRLDENWVNDELRYYLIKALIDTVHDFNTRVKNLKIVLALREDLLDRVFRYARGSGHQEEKYKSMYLILSWQSKDIESLLDKRVQRLVKDQYTTDEVTLRDLLPSHIGKIDPVKYLIDRTMLRPRDAIMFFNECIVTAEGTPKLTQATIRRAEGVYSEQRLRALADEWYVDYPSLPELVFFLKAMSSKFKVAEFLPSIEEKLLAFLSRNSPTLDSIYELAQEKYNTGDYAGFMNEMLLVLFRVGAVGIKTESYTTVKWSHPGHLLIREELNENASVHVHPAFWRVLGIRPVD